MGQKVPLYLCVPNDMPAPQYKVTTIKKISYISLQLRRQQSQRSELCYSENHSQFPLSGTSPVFLHPWINYKALITLHKLLIFFFFFSKTIFSCFPIPVEWTLMTVRYICSLTAGLNVTFCLSLSSGPFVPGGFSPLGSSASSPTCSHWLPIQSSGLCQLSVEPHAALDGWINERMNEQISWYFTFPFLHRCGPQE